MRTRDTGLRGLAGLAAWQEAGPGGLSRCLFISSLNRFLRQVKFCSVVQRGRSYQAEFTTPAAASRVW